MKCPKCQYLGFETGDRCKNCGYDFSLVEFRHTAESSAPSATERDLLDTRLRDAWTVPTPDDWDRFDFLRKSGPPPASNPVPEAKLHDNAEVAPSVEPALPLFALTADDQPLVRMPAAPRRPLAVRRATENPRLRQTPRDVPMPEPEALPDPDVALTFPEEPTPATSTAAALLRIERVPAGRDGRGNRDGAYGQDAAELASRATSPVLSQRSSSAQRRCIAAVIDYALLLGIDTAILYFTVRMSGLEMADWRLLPAVPLALFLGVIALAYVGVFTAIGGQTIGKMAARIAVVSDDEESDMTLPVGALDAFKRTAAVMVSWLTVGLGFLPALVGDHRALHDRLSGTRVVDLA